MKITCRPELVMLVSSGVKSWRQERGERMVKVPWEEIMAVALLLIRRERKGGNNKPTITITGQAAFCLRTVREKHQFTVRSKESV